MIVVSTPLAGGKTARLLTWMRDTPNSALWTPSGDATAMAIRLGIHVGHVALSLAAVRALPPETIIGIDDLEAALRLATGHHVAIVSVMEGRTA